MSVNRPDAESQVPKDRTRARWILRILAIVIGVIAVIDLIITIIPQPAPPQVRILPGGVVSSTSYSSTEDSIVAAKNWVEVYLNPVGWVALGKGHGPKNLYVLKRNENWKNALETGQVLSLLVLLVLPFPLWLVSLRVGKRLLRDGKNGDAGL